MAAPGFLPPLLPTSRSQTETGGVNFLDEKGHSRCIARWHAEIAPPNRNRIAGRAAFDYELSALVAAFLAALLDMILNQPISSNEKNKWRKDEPQRQRQFSDPNDDAP